MTEQKPKFPTDLVVPAASAAIFCFVAPLGEWEYGYYQILRIVATASAAWLCYKFFADQRLRWPLMAVAIFFNPVFKVRLDRDIWGVLDWAAASVFVWVIGEVLLSWEKDLLKLKNQGS